MLLPLLALFAVTVASPTDLKLNPLSSASRYVCPSRMESCSCTTTAAGVIVRCSNLNDNGQLITALDNIKGFEVEQFSVLSSKVTIETNDFATVRLLRMNVENSEVTVGGSGSFGDSDQNIKTVIFENTKIKMTHIKPGREKLETLFFKNCSFEKYSSDWFNGLSVAWLRIEDSPLIKEPIAAKLRDVVKYTHIGSGLTELKRDMLPENSAKLRELDFSGNKISSINPGFLHGADGLLNSNDAKINLDKNHLQTLHEEAFKGFTGTLLADSNCFVCNSTLLWLKRALNPANPNGLKSPQRLPCTEGDYRRGVRDLPDDIKP